MQINSICVCGAGTMGSGIALAAAQAGLPTILYELDPVVLENAKKRIAQNLAELVSKNKLTEAESKNILNRFRYTNKVDDCLADLCIEAIIEKEDAKVALFNQLAEMNHSDCVLATNTSSLSVSKIADRVQHPGRVIGLHFFNPATIMKLVEVVVTEHTNPGTIETAISLVRQMGKTAVQCRDAPGFIVNRVARPYYIEALRLVEEKKILPENLDALMESTGFRLGPFRLMDLIGNDVNYAVSCSVYEQLGKPVRLKPSVIQEQKVKEGKLGKKSGEGYYQY